MFSRLQTFFARRLGAHLGFMALMVMFVTSVAASMVYTIYRMRAEALAGQAVIAAVQARAIEDHLTQSLNLIDQTLVSMLLTDPGAPDRMATRSRFESALRHVPALRSLSLMDGEARIVASSNPANIGVRVDGGDFLPPQSARCDLARIGRLWQGRDFSEGRLISNAPLADTDAPVFLPMWRCLHPGSDSAALLAALNPDYFINHYRSRLASDEGRVEVLRYDGVTLLSTDEHFVPGAQGPVPGFVASLSEVESGTFEQTLSGHQSVITAFRASRVFPLVVVLHLSREYALTAWAAESRRLLQIVLPVLLVVVLLASWLYVHLRRIEARRAEAQQRERERERQAATVFTHSREGILITNEQAVIMDVNEAFTRITGFSREEALGQTPRLLRSERQSKEFYAGLWRDLLARGYWSGEIWNRRKSGEVFAVLLTISAVRDSQGKTQSYVALLTDITPMKERQLHLEHIAHYDVLTHLPNRALLADRLQQGMLQSQRRGKFMALAFVDLDGFKAVNDTHGHDAGDMLLSELAQRMRTILREGDTLARVGGDEFVIILVDLDQRCDCEPVLARLLQAVAEPLLAGDVRLQVSASVGVSFYPQAGADAELLMRQADQAMYQAKQAGKNRFRIFAGSDERCEA